MLVERDPARQAFEHDVVDTLRTEEVSERAHERPSDSTAVKDRLGGDGRDVRVWGQIARQM